MEQIVIQITDREKAHTLYQVLSALDFVNSITTIELEQPISSVSSSETQTDFLSFAGLWANREDINIHSLRQRAWPRRRGTTYDPL